MTGWTLWGYQNSPSCAQSIDALSATCYMVRRYHLALRQPTVFQKEGEYDGEIHVAAIFADSVFGGRQSAGPGLPRTKKRTLAHPGSVLTAARSYGRIIGASDRIKIDQIGCGHKASGHRLMLKKSAGTDPSFDLRVSATSGRSTAREPPVTNNRFSANGRRRSSTPSRCWPMANWTRS